MGEEVIILPEFHISGIQRRRHGEKYISLAQLLAFLYKAAAEPGQDPAAAQTFRYLAEALEEGFR